MELNWLILSGVSVILLVIYFRHKNAIWGGLTIGLIVGLVISLIKWDFVYLVKSGVVGTLIGFGAELLGKLSDRMKK